MRRVVLIMLFGFLAIAPCAWAGGFQVIGVTINGERLIDSKGVVLQSGQQIEICAEITGYFFSGAGNETAALMLQLQPKGRPAARAVTFLLEAGKTTDRGGMRD